MLYAVWSDHLTNRNEPAVRNRPAPYWLDMVQETWVAASFTDVVLQHLFAHDGFDPIAAYKNVARRDGAVGEQELGFGRGAMLRRAVAG